MYAGPSRNGDSNHLAQLFSHGNYCQVAMHGPADQWQALASLGLIGNTREALEALHSLDGHAQRFYRAVIHWLEGEEAEAARLLETVPTEHARNLLRLLRKPRIKVLAQLSWNRKTYWDLASASSCLDRFELRNISFEPSDSTNEPHADIHKFYDPHDPPDLYVCQMVEWHLIPPNLQELPCPLIGQTADYDLYIQTVCPWLRLFDEIIVLDASAWHDVTRLVDVPVTTFPKSFGVSPDLPPVPPGPRYFDIFQSGTVLYPYHPDKARLLLEVLHLQEFNIQIFNEFLPLDKYKQVLGNSKVCYSYVRNPTAMPSRAVEALSMGCATLIPHGNTLTLFLGEEEGVLTFRPGGLTEKIRHVLDNWQDYEKKAQRGAGTVRREFDLARITSHFLRFLVFLAARPRGERRFVDNRDLYQKRGVVKKGFLPAYGRNPILKAMEASSMERIRQSIASRGATSRRFIDLAREKALGFFFFGVRSRKSWHACMDLYEQGIAAFPDSLVLRFNQFRVARHFGKETDSERAMAQARRLLELPEEYWRVDPMEDVFPWDFHSNFFNYRSYFDLVTEHRTRGRRVDDELLRLILASINHYLGRHHDDVGSLRQAALLDPEFPFYKYWYARALMDRGQDGDFEQAGKILVELATGSLLFVEAFCLLEQLHDRGLFTCSEFAQLESVVTKYCYRTFTAGVYGQKGLTADLMKNF